MSLRRYWTRWSYQSEDADWDGGTDLRYLRELVGYWQDSYDWRKHETALNQFAQFKAKVDDIGIHFIHERAKGPKPFPLILTHGYPDSFYRFAKIIPMLTDPESFGGRAEDAFDVVAPRSAGLRVFRQTGEARNDLSRQRSLGAFDDRQTRLRAVWGAWRRLGQHGH
jgi:hypothetical protein